MVKRIVQLSVSLCLIHFVAASDGPYNHLPALKPDANMARSEIPPIYKWNLADLCPNDATWADDFKQCKTDLKTLKDSNTANELDIYLKTFFDLDERINRLTLYANLQREVETTNQDVIARHEMALNLTEELMAEGAILRQTILKLSDEALSNAMRDQPAIKEFLPYINSLHRRVDHILSPAEERLLSLAGDNLWAQIDLNELPSASEKAFRAVISDMTLPVITGPDGKDVRLSFANYVRFRTSPDRNVRKNAVSALFTTLRNFENTFATTLGEQAKFSVFLSRARGYPTVLEAYLDKDALTQDVYMNLISTVRANVKPLHKYIDLRKKVLGYDEIHLYDLYIPMAEPASLEMNYNTGVGIILNALNPLGDDYTNQLKKGMDPANGWIDLYPCRSKNRGAFSAATYGIHPYIKMNFQDRFNDVSTLAHEYGHAMHSYLAMSHQPYLAWRYVPFLAEIASTCNEALLSRYMIDNAATDKEKAWLLSELLETMRTTIYRQTLFAEFELNVHQLAEAGKPVNAEKLNKIYGDLLRTYYGPNYSIDENDPVEWAYVPHFYYKYYIFTYATGLYSGIAFAEKILKEGPGARDAYLEMLKAGSSKAPLELLREAGLDLSKPEAIESALHLFDQTVDALQELLAKKD
jgi:oligoendopeptidase F